MTILVSILAMAFCLMLRVRLVSVHCEDLVNAIDRLYKSEIDALIRQKTNEGRMNESVCWCELRHAMGRLLSYLKAVEVLISTRNRFPELFTDFNVSYVSSSKPAQCPFRGKRRPEALSADSIIGRMTSDPGIMASCRGQALELQKFGLDEGIQKQAGHKNFRPIVHAEVLLLDSLEKDSGTHPSRFFNGYKYIGCSKPTCRLCDYFFSVHPSGVEVRQTHRNLYPSWRMPDVLQSQGPRAEKEREKHMNKIVARIREDAFRTMNEKIPERKHHDSNTEPTYPFDSVPGWEPGYMEHATAILKDLKIEALDPETIQDINERVLLDGSTIFQEGSDDEEDGGVKLK
jgi:hypothetical protein